MKEIAYINVTDYMTPVTRIKSFLCKALNALLKPSKPFGLAYFHHAMDRLIAEMKPDLIVTYDSTSQLMAPVCRRAKSTVPILTIQHGFTEKEDIQPALTTKYAAWEKTDKEKMVAHGFKPEDVIVVGNPEHKLVHEFLNRPPKSFETFTETHELMGIADVMINLDSACIRTALMLGTKTVIFAPIVPAETISASKKLIGITSPERLSIVLNKIAGELH